MYMHVKIYHTLRFQYVWCVVVIYTSVSCYPSVPTYAFPCSPDPYSGLSPTWLVPLLSLSP